MVSYNLVITIKCDSCFKTTEEFYFSFSPPTSAYDYDSHLGKCLEEVYVDLRHQNWKIDKGYRRLRIKCPKCKKKK